MNDAKIYHSKSGTLETMKWRRILFPGSYASIQATAISSSFNSRFWVYYEVNSQSLYEFVKKPVESSL